jgi:lipopolysaccharide transport system ATP-binding protein
LAFAVASFLDPEILIVDEVLAVGDAAFQRKSLGRLNSASAEQGRTVLFVSHNLRAIRTFCRRVLLIEKGRLVFDGPAAEGISRYVSAIPKTLDLRETRLADRLNRTSGAVRITGVSCRDDTGRKTWEIQTGATATLSFDFEALETVPDLAFGIRLSVPGSGERLTTIREVISAAPIKHGCKGVINVVLPDVPVRPGEYALYIWMSRVDNRFSYDVVDENVDLPFLTVVSDSKDTYERDGYFSLPHRIEIQGI